MHKLASLNPNNHTPMLRFLHPLRRDLLLLMLGATDAGSQIGWAGGDEGRLMKLTVYSQMSAGGPVAYVDPFRFVATIRDSVSQHTGEVELPEGATWSPNPVTLVTPPLLFGGHFVFEQAFASVGALNEAFPDGSYIFDITRTYSTATTQFSQQVEFALGQNFPVPVPGIANLDWLGGKLQLHPAQAQIFYNAASGVSFQWGLVTNGGSGGGSSSNAPGLLDLTGFVTFDQEYQGAFRFAVTESAYTVEDQNAPTNSYQRQSTYSALRGNEVRFTLQTITPAPDLHVIAATYTSASLQWDVRALLESKIQSNAIFYRLNEWELTNNSPTGQNGEVYVKYENRDGIYEGTAPFVRNNFNNYLILPNPIHSRLPLAFTDWAERRFTPSEMADISVSGHLADPDSDGTNNLREFAAGTHPMVSDSGESAPASRIVFDGGVPFLALSCRRNRYAQITIGVEQTNNLRNWAPMSVPATVESIPGNAEQEFVTWVSSTPLDWVQRMFLRLVVTDPNTSPAP